MGNKHRSELIRESERATDNLRWAMEHLNRILQSYLDGVEKHIAIESTPGEGYITIVNVCNAVLEGLDETIKVVEKLKESL